MILTMQVSAKATFNICCTLWLNVWGSYVSNLAGRNPAYCFEKKPMMLLGVVGHLGYLLYTDKLLSFLWLSLD